mgnify:CR=1 FL=1
MAFSLTDSRSSLISFLKATLTSARRLNSDAVASIWSSARSTSDRRARKRENNPIVNVTPLSELVTVQSVSETCEKQRGRLAY